MCKHICMYIESLTQKIANVAYPIKEIFSNYDLLFLITHSKINTYTYYYVICLFVKTLTIGPGDVA
jgi:hypothetical protein